MKTVQYVVEQGTGSRKVFKTIFPPVTIVRGRWASLALGAAVARSRAESGMDEESYGYERQLEQSQRQIEEQQRQIEALQAQKQQKPQQEDPTQKLQKFAALRQKGLLTEEEFQKLKMSLLSEM